MSLHLNPVPLVINRPIPNSLTRNNRLSNTNTPTSAKKRFSEFLEELFDIFD